MLKGNIIISKERYWDLCIAEEWQRRLENGGVDNWDWYGRSLNPDDEESLEDFEISERKRIKELKGV